MSEAVVAVGVAHNRARMSSKNSKEVVLKKPTFVGVSVVVAGVSMGRTEAVTDVGPHIGYPFDDEENVDEDMPGLLEPWGLKDGGSEDGVGGGVGEEVEAVGEAGPPLVSAAAAREDAEAWEGRRAICRQIVGDAGMANDLEEEEELEAARSRRARGLRCRRRGRRNLRRLSSENSVTRRNTRRHP